MSVWIRCGNEIAKVYKIHACPKQRLKDCVLSIEGVMAEENFISHTIDYKFDNGEEAKKQIPKLMDLISEVIEHSKVINLEKIEEKFLKEITPKTPTHTPKKEK